MRTLLGRFPVRALRLLGWTLVILLPPVLVAQHNVRAAWENRASPPPPAPAAPLPEVPLPDPARPLAVVLVGDGFTEATDLMAPFELLAASGAYETYLLAAERKPLALFPGTLDVLPHFTLEEWDGRVGRSPEVIVLPYMYGGRAEAHGELEAWLRRHWPQSNVLVTICGGSQVAAAAGLLEGRRATSHRNVLRLVRNTDPGVEWVEGVRYVDDGNLISSAGITSGIDAVLHLLSREVGREAARAAASRVHYPHLGYLDDAAFRLPRGNDRAALWNAAFVPPLGVGIFLEDGASELHLAALTDTYPRSLAARLVSVSERRRYVVSRHGLHLVPRWGLDEAPPVRRMFWAGGSRAGAPAALEAWAAARGVRPERLEAGAFPYDRLLEELSGDLGAAAAMAAARGLEYPVEQAALLPSMLPARGLRNALLLALLGLGAGLGTRLASRRLRRRGFGWRARSAGAALLLAAAAISAAPAGAVVPPGSSASPRPERHEPILAGFLPGFLETRPDSTVHTPSAAAPPDSTVHAQSAATPDRSLLPLPILYRTPETGWAGGAAVIRLRWAAPGEGRGHPVVSDEVTLVYTEEGQFMGGLGTDRYLDGGRVRVFGSVHASHFPAHFHGIGRDLPPGEHESYTSRMASVAVGARWRLGSGRQLGGGIAVSRYGVRDLEPEGRLGSGEVSGGEGGTVASLTLAAGLDTRDGTVAPRRGTYLELRGRGADGRLLGDFGFSQGTLDARRYHPVRGDHVVAAQLFVTGTWGRVPFQELPTMGGPEVMRGYHPAHHRDRAVAAGQVEYRSPFLWRFGFTAFSGAGLVSDGWRAPASASVRWSGGAGLRFALDPEQRLHLRADYGVGRRSSALYLGIREAF